MTRLSQGERLRRNEMFRQGMLWCTKCKQFHPIKDYQRHNRASSNYGYFSHCCRCSKARRIANKEQISQWFKERNNALKAKFVQLAGSKCQRCGYDAFNASLDFHHVYPAKKEHMPTRIIYSGNFERAWRELDKCCLLCQNCHHAYEAGQWRAEFIKRDGLLGWTVGGELPLDDSRYEVEKPPKYE